MGWNTEENTTSNNRTDRIRGDRRRRTQEEARIERNQNNRNQNSYRNFKPRRYGKQRRCTIKEQKRKSRMGTTRKTTIMKKLDKMIKKKTGKITPRTAEQQEIIRDQDAEDDEIENP